MERQTYLLIDGENIDATLGNSILGRRPRPEERPRWDRLLEWSERTFDQPVTGLFFLAAGTEMPTTFVQALIAIGFKPVPLSGAGKVVDIAIQRTAEALVVARRGRGPGQPRRRLHRPGLRPVRRQPPGRRHRLRRVRQRRRSAGCPVCGSSTSSTTSAPSTPRCRGSRSSRSTSSTRSTSSDDGASSWFRRSASRAGSTTSRPATVRRPCRSTTEALQGSADDGSTFAARLPFATAYDGVPDVDAFLADAAAPGEWGVLLVRKGGFAVARLAGPALVEHKIGQRHVQGRTKAGGQSQQRFARRRDNQARQAYEAAADHAARILRPAPLVTGGDHPAVDEVLSDPRLAGVQVVEPWLPVPDPRRAVLDQAILDAQAIRVDVTNAVSRSRRRDAVVGRGVSDPIEVRGLVKRFGSTRALDGLDLEVAAGEVHGFLGPNGSGQVHHDPGAARACSASTAARSACSGSTRGATPPTIHRRLAYVPGDVSLWPNLSGGETIDLLLRMRGVDPRDTRRAELLERFEPRPHQEGSRLLQGQPAEGGAGRGLRRPGRAAAARRADLGPRPADGAGLQRVPGRAQGDRHDRAAVEPHPQRGRAARRPGDDHPGRSCSGDRDPRPTCDTCGATGCGPRCRAPCPT